MKKVALCISEEKKPAPLDNRFGRAAFYYILDYRNGEILERVANPHREDAQGAGIASIQMLFDKGTQAVIGPQLGPKAADLCEKLGIALYEQGEWETLEEVWAQWLRGTLSPAHKKMGGLRKA